MKIRKAEVHEKRQYTGLYPLYGFVTVPAVLGGEKTRMTIPVEYLGEGRDQPNYEAIAPKGMHFDGPLHSVIGFTQKDLLDHLGELEECYKDCD